MAPLKLLTAFAALVVTLLQVANGAPLPTRKQMSFGSGENEVRCETVDKYTTQWFLDNALPNFRRDFYDTALFYSRGMSTIARSYAARHGLITIWDVWPCPLYNHHQQPSNPMRCIHHNNETRTTFYENMSRAFALKARVSAKVMHSFEDYDTPPQEGIWGRIEFPVLSGERSGIDWLSKIREDGSGWRVFWRRLRGAVGAQLSRFEKGFWRADLRKRGNVGVQACMLPSEYAFFDDVDW